MTTPIKADLCVIGAGPGGLSVAAGAVQMGASVVLIEEGKMGGDCLNYGCVPSKALIAAGKAAHAHRSSGPLGVAGHEPEIDYAAAMAHVEATIAKIAPHDSVERFEGLGVRVIKARARFTGPAEVTAGDQVIKARRFVVATGSAPVVLPVPGLDQVPYMTNETLWENRTRPDHLIVIGGGPIGIELAQAHRRLGSKVTVLEAFTALGKDDPELTAIALDQLRSEGVDIREGAKVTQFSGQTGAITATLEDAGTIEGSHLLMAVGRKPNVNGMGLDEAGIEHDRKGVVVDKGLRSVSNRRVYAIGDVAGGLQFTHVANYHAGLVIRNALFRLPVRNQTRHIPWVTYTDPELANVGLTEDQAREAYGGRIEVHKFTFDGSDRALAEGKPTGLVKAVFSKRGKILGCGIVGAQAGELIHPWALAISAGLKAKHMAGFVAPYPTLGEANKRAAGAYFAPRLFDSALVKWAVRNLARLG
ncbi:MAG: FAD-dependent oxidoreductase [Paracoccaceae bacterium]|nr:FAD-dependent oxidoreductase [Paracoccaceae bacterium]